MFFWVSSSLRHVSDNFQALGNSMVNNDQDAIFNHQFDLFLWACARSVLLGMVIVGGMSETGKGKCSQ